MSIQIRKHGDPLKATREGIIAGNIEIASNVTTQAKALAPGENSTGQLRNSIMWNVGGLKGGNDGDMDINVSPEWNEGYVGSAVLHAIYQEFGTRYMDAQPYLRPAIDLVVKGKAPELVKKAIDEKMYAHVKRVNV